MSNAAFKGPLISIFDSNNKQNVLIHKVAQKECQFNLICLKPQKFTYETPCVGFIHLSIAQFILRELQMIIQTIRWYANLQGGEGEWIHTCMYKLQNKSQRNLFTIIKCK